MTKKHIIFRCDLYPPLGWGPGIGAQVCSERRWTHPHLPETDITFVLHPPADALAFAPGRNASEYDARGGYRLLSLSLIRQVHSCRKVREAGDSGHRYGERKGNHTEYGLLFFIFIFLSQCQSCFTSSQSCLFRLRKLTVFSLLKLIALPLYHDCWQNHTWTSVLWEKAQHEPLT